MDKRLARNKVLEDKRASRLKARGNAKSEFLSQEAIDLNSRRQRRREHFLLSYQSSWTEETLANATDSKQSEGFVAPELSSAKVGSFTQGDTSHLDNEGNVATTSVTAFHKSEAQRLVEENEKKLIEEAAKQAVEDMLDVDDLMKDLEDEPSVPVKTEPATEPNEDVELAILNLEDDIQALKEKKNKLLDKQDELDEEMAKFKASGDQDAMDQAELDMLDCEEEIVGLEDEIQKKTAELKKLEATL